MKIGEGRRPAATQGCPISPHALCEEIWETRTLIWVVEGYAVKWSTVESHI
jgi:hypothetical protein